MNRCIATCLRTLRLLIALAATLTITAKSHATILFNEVYVNPPGTDDNREFIELISTTGGTESLSGLVLLILDGAGSGIGGIDDAYDLASFATGSNGLLLLGNNFPTVPIGGPYNSLLAPGTAVADPSGAAPFSGMGASDLGNNGFTLLLVRGFTGIVNADLDTNNDGTLDQMPWTQIVDSVGWRIGSGGVFSDTTYAPANLAQGNFTPDSAARLLGDIRPNTAAAWYGGDIGAPDTAYDAVQHFALPPNARVTPGSPNIAPVPEPSTLILTFIGGALLWLHRNRRASDADQ